MIVTSLTWKYLIEGYYSPYHDVMPFNDKDMEEKLKKMFKEIGVKLVDFKVEFGKTADGKIVLADEISPDCCRLWDAKTNDHLDKDRFRRDLGNVMGAYEEIYARLKTLA